MIDPLNPLDPSTLQAAREARGLSRSDLAKLASTQDTTILRIEAGKDPRVSKTWFPIVAALQATALVPAA
jgi:predicted transcriptional regulator